MDHNQQMSIEDFQAQCHEFQSRLGSQIKATDKLGIAVNGTMHFAGFLLAQYIKTEAGSRPVDFQEEISKATGVLANATAFYVNQLDAQQAANPIAANDTKH